MSSPNTTPATISNHKCDDEFVAPGVLVDTKMDTTSPAQRVPGRCSIELAYRSHTVPCSICLYCVPGGGSAARDSDSPVTRFSVRLRNYDICGNILGQPPDSVAHSFPRHPSLIRGDPPGRSTSIPTRISEKLTRAPQLRRQYPFYLVIGRHQSGPDICPGP